MKMEEGGVCAAKGFWAAGVEAGVKYQNRKDMALIYSETPCVCAGTFTTNVVKAAPVLWDKALVENSAPVRAVVVNSGIANACTGEEGMACCKKEAEAAAVALGIPTDSVLIGSTGVIGMQMPIDRLTAGIARLAEEKENSVSAAQRAAEANMTTDTVSKKAAVSFTAGGKTVNMCTMLAFVTCDAAISEELLKKAVKESVDETYNMISVDGDTSTNDTFLFLANGMAGNPEITEENEDYEAFKEALRCINTTLAKKLAGDGEGATALVEVQVKGAKSREDARLLGKSVICSSLTKAAIFGHDANWGRILCALGYSGADFDPGKVELFFQGSAGCIQIYKEGKAADYSEEEAARLLSEKEVTILVDMHMGEESATAWGCDLSYDYVKINADYRS